MSENLVQAVGYDTESLAQHFEKMATQIRLNKDGIFGGAFVLVPPPGVGEPVSSLLLNSANAKLLFWQNLKSVADDTVKAIIDQRSMMR